MSRAFHTKPCSPESASLLVIVLSSINHRPSPCIILNSRWTERSGVDRMASIAAWTTGRSSGWIRSDKFSSLDEHPRAWFNEGLP